MNNNSDLLKFVLQQMAKLDKGEIDTEQAKAQANLAKQANNSLRYELDRTSLLLKLRLNNSEDIEIRNIED